MTDKPKNLSLEGLRGLAALTVVISHCVLCFFPYLHTGDAANIVSGWETTFFNSPFLVIYSGGFSVAVFFVISGYVLSRQFFQFNSAEFIRKAAAKRYVRLGMPVFGAVMLCYGFSRLGLYPAERVGLPKFLAESYAHPLTLGDAMIDGLFGAMVFGHRTFDYVLWTIQIEFFGSLGLFAFLALVGKARGSCIYAALAVVALVATCGDDGMFFSLFIVGAYLHLWASPLRFIPFVVGIVALWLGGYHWNSAAYAGPVWLANLIQSYGVPLNWPVFFNAAGAIMLTWSAVQPGLISNVLKSRVLVWLGEKSFSLYLTHSFVLTSIGAFLFLRGPLDGSARYFLASVVVIGMSVLLSMLFTYLIDAPAIQAANNFARWSAEKQPSMTTGMTLTAGTASAAFGS